MPTAYVNGINIFYKVGGCGEPLLLIMGLGGGHQGWFCQTGAFTKELRTISYDSRGVGKSDKPTGPYSIRTMADDAIGLLDHLGIDKAHVLGVSHGGRVAQELAIDYPERVSKLVVASATTGDEAIEDLHPDMVKAFGVKEKSSGLGVLYHGVTQCPVCRQQHQGEDLWEHLWTEHRAWMFEWARGIDFYKMVALAFDKRLWRMFILPLAWIQMKLTGIDGHIRQIEATMGHRTLDRLHLVTAPTLVITGTEDRLCPPRSSELMAVRIPKARLVKIEGGSHSIHMEMRGRFNREVLEFLRSS